MDNHGCTFELPMCMCGRAKAYISKSMWSPFNGSACSDECGELARDALTAVRETALWNTRQDKMWAVKRRIADMEYRAIECACKRGRTTP